MESGSDNDDEVDEGDDYGGMAFPGMEMPAGAKWQKIDDQIEEMIEEEANPD